MLNDNKIVNIDLLNWPMIAGLDRKKVNQLLFQAYVQRFNASSFLPPVSGVIEGGGAEWRYKIESFLLSEPVLNFKSLDISKSRAEMSMQVLGGTQISQKFINGQWYAQAIEYINPLQGPELLFKLRLQDTPIAVGVEGGLSIDLSTSDDFELTFAESPEEQKLGGDFFKILFGKLKPEQRVYPVGKIELGAIPWFRPKAAVLRTQRKPGKGNDGALLIFVQLETSPAGTLPDDSWDYMLSEEGSARVWLNRYYVYFPLMEGGFKRTYAAKTYSCTPDSKGRYTNVEMIRGDINLKEIAVRTETVLIGDIGRLMCEQEWRFAPIVSPGGGRVVGTLDDTGFSIKGMPFDFKMNFDFYTFHGDDRFIFWSKGWRGELWNFLREEYPIIEDKKMLVTADYSRGELPDIELSPLLLKDDAESTGLAEVSDSGDPYLNPADSDGYARYVAEKMGAHITDWLQGDEAFRILSNHLSGILRADLEVSADLDKLADLVKFNFGEVIDIKKRSLVLDGDVIGDVNPVLTEFRILPLSVNLLAGATHTFKVSPDQEDIEWSLDDPGRSGKLGEISPDGQYTAPAAGQLDGLFRHVRIMAKHKKTGHKSFALVTVIKNALNVNPLIDSTSGIARTLKAGSLGVEGEKLTWSVKKTGTEGSLDKTSGSTVTYTPSTNFGTDPNVIFVVDEVTVSNGKESATSYIVNRKSDPVNVIKYEVNANNTVSCRATVNDKDQSATWKILKGPGKIDATSGLYTADPASTMRFVLIHSLVTIPVVDMEFAGYLILPLPLAEQDRALPGTVKVSSTGDIVREIRPMS
ncbi:hypothetical protein [Pseudomonas laurentiana]